MQALMLLVAVVLGGSLVMACIGSASTLPASSMPDGLGVEIHFLGDQPRDLDLIAAGGFRFIRMDFSWSGVEREKGVYDFALYDQLVEGLANRGLRPVFILSYSNLLYEGSLFSVRTQAGREAFARFAAAGARRYRGKGVIWELWNEPNVWIFWRPEPNPDEYMALVRQVVPAIRQADEEALITAPATADSFLDECCQRGLLQLVDAVSVHLYRGHVQSPETVATDILRVRALINRYAPERPDLPLVCTEWGYASQAGSLWDALTPEAQGDFLARVFLTDLSLGLPLTVWYEWRDGVKPDPGAESLHFGVVGHDYGPKPAYLALQRLVAALHGMHFVKRLQSAPRDYLLLFSDGSHFVIAAWTIGRAHMVEAGPAVGQTLTGTPQYLPVDVPGQALLAEAAWTVRQSLWGVEAGAPPASAAAPSLTVAVRNPFRHKVDVILRAEGPEVAAGGFKGPAEFSLAPGKARQVEWRGCIERRDLEQCVVTVEATLAGHTTSQQVPFRVTNPVVVGVELLLDGSSALTVRNPGGQAVWGQLTARLGRALFTFDVELDPVTGHSQVRQVLPEPGQPVQVASFGEEVRIPLPGASAQGTCRITLRRGSALVADSGLVRTRPLQAALAEWQLWEAGQSAPQPGFEPLQSYGGLRPAVRLAHELHSGTNTFFLAPPQPLRTGGAPHALGVLVRGLEPGMLLQLRYRDVGGRVYQPRFGPAGGWWRMGWCGGVLQAKLEAADHAGWRYLEAPMDEPGADSWGGSGELGLIQLPLQLDGLLVTTVLGEDAPSPASLALDFAGFQLVYRS